MPCVVDEVAAGVEVVQTCLLMVLEIVVVDYEGARFDVVQWVGRRYLKAQI
jgi:hypothetical protein